MRLTRPALAASAAVTTAALVATGVSSPAAARGQDPTQQSRKFRQAVTVSAVSRHLDALQGIADANGGTRASGTPGFAASRDYVVQQLRAAGYHPTVQKFTFPYFSVQGTPTFAQVDPDATSYEYGKDFSIMSFSGSGNIDQAAPIRAVDTDFSPTSENTSGCEAEDFASFPDGAIALIQRGGCSFGQKADNAEQAGAAGAVIFNHGADGETGIINGTLGHPVGIPVFDVGYELGKDLGDPVGTTATMSAQTVNEERTTYNVVAETAKGDASNVVMAGAHLDSVEEGPGINDNGSGSATILEVAKQLAKVKKLQNKVRFAWWGAEEEGLLGAEHYVDDLAENNPAALKDIAAYLNFDMVGSPNFVRFVYDGDDTLGGGAAPGPEGSAQIEQLFTRYFASQHLATEPTAFDGRSDYGPFIDNGVPAGGLFTGAEGVKTPGEAATYGGTAGEPYDACYHQACDTRANVNGTVLDQMSDAVAHAVYVLSQSTASINGKGKVRGPKHGSKHGHKHHGAGHRAGPLATR